MKGKLGEIKLGIEIGNTQCCSFMWSACVDCGKERWVKLIHGIPQSHRCNPCASKRASGKYTRKPLEVRFWTKVLKTDGCWLWQGHRNSITGYGTIQIEGTPHLVHRVAYELICGPIPNGEFVLHKPPCKNRCCVRPEHLYIGTHQNNMDDMVRSITHCTQGHPYDETNTYHRPDGGRDCKICMRRRNKEYLMRQEVEV